jgi:hypothetical protein
MGQRRPPPRVPLLRGARDALCGPASCSQAQRLLPREQLLGQALHFNSRMTLRAHSSTAVLARRSCATRCSCCRTAERMLTSVWRDAARLSRTPAVYSCDTAFAAAAKHA